MPGSLPCAAWGSNVSSARASSRRGEAFGLLRRVHSLAILAALAMFLWPAAAQAIGNVILKTPAPEEQDKSWTLVFDINWGKPPDMPHVAMTFSFQHVTQYEWSLTDQSPERPVFSRKPLSNQPEINLPQDVGFADASGKVWPMTKNFKLTVRRDADFECGEYQLTIHADSSGQVVGRPMRITLKGQNEPVDRRAINIQAPKPPEKKDKPAETDKGKEGESDLPTGDGDPMPSGDPEYLQEAEGPPAEKPKQGGCGCRVAPVHEPRAALGWLAAAGGLGGVAWRRRRRRS